MQNWLLKKYIERKHKAYVLKNVPFHCDDCHKDGIVLLQISVLNLIVWFLLGVITFFISKWIGFSYLKSFMFGIFVWFLCTLINIKLVKPQCRYCLSTNVHLPETSEESTPSSS